MTRIDDMVQFAIDVANDDSHGYSQAYRWPSQGSDFDCSSLMYTAANHAGYDVPLSGYTGTMLADFGYAGFTALPFGNVGLDGLKRGDILLNVEHHTEMYIGDGQNVGAHSSETGGIYGEMGDQTGTEISVTPTYVYWAGWDYVLRPPESDGSDEKEGFDMAECIFIIEDDHDGYKKNDRVYFSTAQGFKYLPHYDCVELLRQMKPGIAEIKSSSGSPWVRRAKQTLRPKLAKLTYGKRIS